MNASKFHRYVADFFHTRFYGEILIHFQLKLDIEELSALLGQAQRQRSKDMLGIEVRKLQTELSMLPESRTSDSKPAAAALDPSGKCYEVKLNNYGWDQSDKFMKLYVTLKNVHTLPEGAVRCNFTDKSLDLRADGLENRNYHMPINNLCEEIDASKSYIKVKTDTIVIFLAKKIPNKSWSHVTGVEKKIKEAKSAPLSDLEKGSDPEENLMSLMKKMYQDGDEDMKKIIAKAWTESQDKKQFAQPDFPNM